VVGLERTLHLDTEIKGRRRLREGERAFLGENRLSRGGFALPVDCGHEAIGGRLDRGDDLVAAFHVPAVVALAVDRDLHEAEHNAAVVGEVETRALSQAQGAAGVEDMEVGLISLQALVRGADVVGHHEPGDDLAVLGNVDGFVRGDLNVGGKGLGEGK
jgi:hypothetical protein